MDGAENETNRRLSIEMEGDWKADLEMLDGHEWLDQPDLLKSEVNKYRKDTKVIIFMGI